MNRTQKAVLGVAMVGSTLVGGGIGAALFGSGASAQTSTSTTTPAAPGSGSGSGYGLQPNGKFVPNEDPAHEAGESAQREAQENAGQAPTVP